MAEALRWHLAPFRRRNPVQHSRPVDVYVQEEDEHLDPQPYSLVRAGQVVYKHPDIADLLRQAVWDLHAHVHRKARDFVFVHSGAVSRDGDALLLPAHMDAGKSSLTLALLTRGWDYLSDELGAIDPITTNAFPFPKLISIDPETLDMFPGLEGRLEDRAGLSAHLPDRYVRPSDVDAALAAAAPARWLVFPTPDFSGDPRLTPLPSAEATRRLAENSMNLYRYADRGIVLLTRVAAGAEAFELSGGSPAERADLLTARLAA